MIFAKSLLTSKTFWLAFIQAVGGVVVVFSTSYPEVGWLVMLKSGVDIMLRVYTTKPIGSIT